MYASGRCNLDMTARQQLWFSAHTIASDVLDGVAEGVAQIKGGPHTTLSFVSRYHLRLVDA